MTLKSKPVKKKLKIKQKLEKIEHIHTLVPTILKRRFQRMCPNQEMSKVVRDFIYVYVHGNKDQEIDEWLFTKKRELSKSPNGNTTRKDE